MNIVDMKKVLEILDRAPLTATFFDMDHEILYIPWFKEKGEIADALEVAGCHWDEDAGSWAHF